MICILHTRNACAKFACKSFLHSPFVAQVFNHIFISDVPDRCGDYSFCIWICALFLFLLCIALEFYKCICWNGFLSQYKCALHSIKLFIHFICEHIMLWFLRMYFCFTLKIFSLNFRIWRPCKNCKYIHWPLVKFAACLNLYAYLLLVPLTRRSTNLRRMWPQSIATH